MADILIRGMEMPKDICGEPGYVDVRIFSDGSVIMAKAAPPYYGKFEAVPLPEGHGRLGDLDALMPDFVKARWEFFSDGDTFLRLVKNAPTIVPAEGGGEADKKTNCSDCGNRNTPVCKYCEHDAEGGGEDG